MVQQDQPRPSKPKLELDQELKICPEVGELVNWLLQPSSSRKWQRWWWCDQRESQQVRIFSSTADDINFVGRVVAVLNTYWPKWKYWLPDSHGQEDCRQTTPHPLWIWLFWLYTNARNRMPFYAATGGRFVTGGTRCHAQSSPQRVTMTTTNGIVPLKSSCKTLGIKTLYRTRCRTVLCNRWNVGLAVTYCVWPSEPNCMLLQECLSLESWTSGFLYIHVWTNTLSGGWWLNQQTSYQYVLCVIQHIDATG